MQLNCIEATEWMTKWRSITLSSKRATRRFQESLCSMLNKLVNQISHQTSENNAKNTVCPLYEGVDELNGPVWRPRLYYRAPVWLEFRSACSVIVIIGNIRLTTLPNISTLNPEYLFVSAGITPALFKWILENLIQNLRRRTLFPHSLYMIESDNYVRYRWFSCINEIQSYIITGIRSTAQLKRF